MFVFGAHNATAISNRTTKRLSNKMNYFRIHRVQEMASRCLAIDYKECYERDIWMGIKKPTMFP